jgi:hypothetical protein
MCFTALDPPPPIPITLMIDLNDVSGTTSIWWSKKEGFWLLMVSLNFL